MYRGPSLFFKVVEHDSNHAVWHADAIKNAPWRETGQYGTLDECWDYIDAQDQTEGFVFQFNSDL